MNNVLTLFWPPIEVAPVEFYESSDHLLWKTPESALFWDLIQRKWSELLVSLQDPALIAKTRRDLHLSQGELAKAAGISRSLICMIEGGTRRATQAVVEKLWSTMYRIDQERKAYTTPEVLVRIENECAVVTRRERL